METSQEQAQVPGSYGVAFKKNVTKLVDELGKLEFVPQPVKEQVTRNAAQLCLVEAQAEERAVALAKRAKAEWDGKYSEKAKSVLVQLKEAIGKLAP